MSEIEKMKKYIERTKLDKYRYCLSMAEGFSLAHMARETNDFPFEVVTLAFNYGKAKGYRAAKAEARK